MPGAAPIDPMHTNYDKLFERIHNRFMDLHHAADAMTETVQNILARCDNQDDLTREIGRAISDDRLALAVALDVAWMAYDEITQEETE